MRATRQELKTADGVTVSTLVVDGAEPSVVVLHGLAGSSREFIPTAERLNGRRVILVDQRGHGHSTRRPLDTSRAAFVDDTVRVIDALATGPVDIVGHSMGAHTALLTAAARPDLVRRLVMLEGDQGGGTPQEHRALGEFFASWPAPFPDRAAASAFLGDGVLARAWVDDLEERADGLHPRFDPDVMVDTITAVAEPRWSAWESVQTPTLVVYADGGMFEEEQKARFVSRSHHVTRVDLIGASHDAHLDAFEQWIAVLLAFLDDVR